MTLAVLAVWIYIEMEPVLSQNAGAGFFGQQGQGQVQAQAQDWSGNAPQLVPQNYLDQGIRSQGYGQGMPSMPQNQMPMPRNDSMMGGGGMAANQFQQMPQQQAGMPMFGFCLSSVSIKSVSFRRTVSQAMSSPSSLRVP